jgi:hypothetical protein
MMMKSIKTVCCAVVLAGLSMSAMANTYSWVDSNGRKNYSDIQPVGVSYSVKYHASQRPTPQPIHSSSHTPVVAQPALVAMATAGDSRVRDFYIADASSAMRERNRTQARECLGMEQSMARISSSRNRTIDPETGGSLEERQLREIKDSYSALCAN